STLLPFTYPSTPDLPPLSLHDALPILLPGGRHWRVARGGWPADGAEAVRERRGGRVLLPEAGPGGAAALDRDRGAEVPLRAHRPDRKSTRLNSSHVAISYAVFCLKKKI